MSSKCSFVIEERGNNFHFVQETFSLSRQSNLQAFYDVIPGRQHALNRMTLSVCFSLLLVQQSHYMMEFQSQSPSLRYYYAVDTMSHCPSNSPLIFLGSQISILILMLNAGFNTDCFCNIFHTLMYPFSKISSDNSTIEVSFGNPIINGGHDEMARFEAAESCPPLLTIHG